MLFNSFAFALFFPTVFVIYWSLPRRAQNVFLLVASYFFYGYWDWRFLSLIAISTIVDYISGLQIQHQNELGEQGSKRNKKLWLVVSVCTNLGILGLFKYFDFFLGSFESLATSLGINVGGLYLNVILPVGISFYTFQTMSYSIDIYRGEMKATRNLLDFAVYVAFFPQLVAGPIERAKALLPRIQAKRHFSWSQFQHGLHLIILGLFQKVFVADNLGPYVDRIFESSDPTYFEVIVGSVAFAFQLYGDFAGYSNIARGCGRLLGIELMVNFNHPYVAANPSDRWRRWHISLSSWLRDYLYFPLGGSRGSEYKTYRNLGLVMLLGGLWHGAGWNYVLWGAWEGTMLIIHRALGDVLDKTRVFSAWVPRSIRRSSSVLIMFIAVTFGWITFRCQSMADVEKMYGSLLTGKGSADLSLITPVIWFILALVTVELTQYSLTQDKWEKIHRIPLIVRNAVYTVLIYLVAFHGAAAKSFIYFQF